MEGEGENQTRPMLVILGVIFALVAVAVIWSDEESEISKLSVPYVKQMCGLKDICNTYRDERMNCATAGSYERCMSIRMKEDVYSTAKAFCSNDGNIQPQSKAMPDFFQCVLASYYK